MINLENDWKEILKDEFEKKYYKELRTLLIKEYENYEVFPKAEDLFNAFKYTSYKDLKVLILGQDPYHDINQAHGLAFSVKKGVKIPPSLRNIYKELKSDLGVDIPEDGYLKKWADEGVMLLNTTLSVRAHSPMSHSKIGWEIFTDNVIKKINEKEEPVVYILWGNHARSKKKFITNKNHFIIESAHPSPLSANRGFLGSRPFSRAQKFLRSKNVEPPSFKL